MFRPSLLAISFAMTFHAISAQAQPRQASASGLVNGSEWLLLNRSVFDNREYRNGAYSNGARNAFKPVADRNGYAEEWAYGLMGTYRSGFTTGAVGLGIDAHLYYGRKLDSGGGRAGKARLLGIDSDNHVKDDMTRGGVAVKLRAMSTTLTYGEQRIKTPVFSSSDSRLLPETATGFFLQSREFTNLSLVTGHFTESTDRNASSHDRGFVVNYSNAQQGSRFDFAGVSYGGTESLTASLYSSLYEDSWRQHYLGSTYSYPLGESQALSFALNLYRTTDTGQALSGRIDNSTWSLQSSYASGAHTISLGYQNVDGDTPFDYVTRGAIFLGNAAQLSDFNAPNERSWQLRYALTMSTLGFPGLTLSGAYLRGSGIDGSHSDPAGGYAYLGYGQDGKHWERDLEVRYTLQNGAAEGLTISLRHSVHRANTAQAELDTDHIRLAVELPFSGGIDI